jgi:UDP-galactopyranose mutase
MALSFITYEDYTAKQWGINGRNIKPALTGGLYMKVYHENKSRFKRLRQPEQPFDYKGLAQGLSHKLYMLIIGYIVKTL